MKKRSSEMVKFLFVLGFVLSLLGFSGWPSTVAYASHKGVGSSEGHYCATKYNTRLSPQELVNYIHRQKRRYCHSATPSDIDSCARLVRPCLEWIADGCGGQLCTEKVEKVEPLVSTMSKASSEYLDEFDELYLDE